MKKIISFGFLVFAILNLQGQVRTIDLSFNSNNMQFIKENGLSFKPVSDNPYEDIEGSPFFIDSFKEAVILLNTPDSKPIYLPKAKINLYTNEVIYQDENNKILTPSIEVKTIYFIDNLQSRKILYQFDYLNLNNKNYFVRTLNAGKYKLTQQYNLSFKEREVKPMLGMIPAKFSKQLHYWVSTNINEYMPISKISYKNVSNIIKLTDANIAWLKKENNRLDSQKSLIDFLNYLNL